MYNEAHITMFYVQRSEKTMPIKFRDGLMSSLILSLAVTWISIVSAFLKEEDLLLLVLCTECSPSSLRT